ncbi:MAG: helix-turn-helix transcriptional regulator [Syntrophobacteraceae bacterium]
MSLGERLRIVRDGRTQKDFAAEVGVSTNTYAMYERDERSPDADFLRLTCQKFDVDPRWLLMAVAPGLAEEDIQLLSEAIITSYFFMFFQWQPDLLKFAPKIAQFALGLYQIGVANRGKEGIEYLRNLRSIADKDLDAVLEIEKAQRILDDIKKLRESDRLLDADPKQGSRRQSISRIMPDLDPGEPKKGD